jgi:RecB family exonuclease
MIPNLLKERDEPEGSLPHLSFSRINRYLTCPEQYRLYYLEKLRPKVPSANLVFGNIIHQVLAGYLLRKEDPVKGFAEMWGLIKQVPLTYGERDSWEKLNTTGEAMLRKFLKEEVPKLGAVRAVEQPFTFSTSGIEMPMVGFIDLVAELNGQETVIDFKTAASSYDEDDAALSDQLTVYRLAEPGVEQLALCVLVKTKEPKIQWHVTKRNGEQLAAYLAKAKHVVGEITAGRFYTRSGFWCAWCDYRPLCVGNKTKAAETLVKVA